jgi:hypothetical protein
MAEKTPWEWAELIALNSPSYAEHVVGFVRQIQAEARRAALEEAWEECVDHQCEKAYGLCDCRGCIARDIRALAEKETP